MSEPIPDGVAAGTHRSLSFAATLEPSGIVRDRRIEIGADGAIAAISPGGPPYDGFLAIPGMPNAHSHVFQRALAGLGEVATGSDTFWSWRDEMYRLANAVTPEQLLAIARQAFVEMLRGGFTHLIEFHYLVHGVDGARGREMTDAVAGAARDVGLPLTLLPVYYRTSGFDGATAGSAQRRFAHDSVDDYLRFVERCGKVVGGAAPHSLRAVPAGDLAELVAGIDALLGSDAPLHIHVSEQTAEVEECLARFGRTPIEHLFDHVEAGPRWNLVHATHATPSEREAIRATGTRVILCPLTEAYLGDGIFEAVEHARGGGSAAIGTDSNVRISAIEELRTLEYGQRLRDRMRARLGTASGLGAPLWNRLAGGGAKAAGAPIGRLEPGRRADFLVLDDTSPRLAGRDPETALDTWLVGGETADIAAVHVGGRRVVDGGSVAGDGDIAEAFGATIRALRTR
ncbi:MAG: formimidoylglutamate deiminase [Gemmatimonadota bacterium]|nr:formimidoylglutamate deiminase [Gemmatimonadota bacterium]